MARIPDSEEVKAKKAQIRGETYNKQQMEEESKIEPSTSSDTVSEAEFTEELKEPVIEETHEDTSSTASFNPLSGDTKSSDRDYTKGAKSETVIEEVEEIFTQPSLDLNNSSESGKTQAPPVSENVNPVMNDLSPEQKRQAAEAAFDMCISFYKMLCDGGKWLCELSDNKVAELVENDEINLHIKVPMENDNGVVEWITFAEGIKLYNETCGEVFKYDEEFIKNIKEPTIREFMKRSIGFTDLQLIMFYGIKQGLTMLISMGTLMYLKNSLLGKNKAKHQKNKEMGVYKQPPPVTQPAAQPVTETPPPAPQPIKDEKIHTVETETEEIKDTN